MEALANPAVIDQASHGRYTLGKPCDEYNFTIHVSLRTVGFQALCVPVESPPWVNKENSFFLSFLVGQG